MTERFSGRNRSTNNQSGVVSWKNTSGEIIPAFGVFRLSTYDATDNFYNAIKPDGEEGLYFVNGPIPVAVNAFGESTHWGPSSQIGKVGTSVFGDTVGPEADSWEMTTSGAGWRVFSDPAGGICALIRASDPSPGGAQIISFAIVSSDPTTRSALVEVRQRTGAGLAYGEDPDTNTLTVYDTDGCWLNEPNVDLTGRLGKAVLQYVDAEAEAAHFDYDVPEKYFNVLNICCANLDCS